MIIKITVTTDNPNKEIERTEVLFGIAFISLEMGKGDEFFNFLSTSPRHWVITHTLVLVTSGNASIGVCI